MLNLQRELKSGKTLNEVCDPLGIEFKEQDGEVIFNYSMIDSPKDHPIVVECRGLILYSDNWDVSSYGFQRFFNYGEGPADKLPESLEECQVLEKLDGTLINLRWDRNKNHWAPSTRKMLYAEGQVGDLTDKTFHDLFWTEAAKARELQKVGKQWIPDYYKDYTLVFELCGPLNRIVTPYKDSFITLLTARNINTLKEMSRFELHRLSEDICVPVVKAYGMKDWQFLMKMENMDPCFEGFVVVHEQPEGSHKRVKIKNPSYLAIFHLTSSHSERSFMELIKRGDQAEFLNYFPEYTEHINKLLDGLKEVKDTIIDDWKEWVLKLPYPIGTIKDMRKDRAKFAQFATKRKFPSLLFQLYDGKIQGNDLKLLELRTDNLLEMLHRA